MNYCDYSTMVELGDRLLAAMKARNIKIRELSDAIGMSYQGVRKVVRNETKSMEAGNLLKIAKHLNISSVWLESGDGHMELPANDTGTPVEIPLGAIPIDPNKNKRIWVVGKGAGGLPERIWTDGDYPVGVTDRFGLVGSTDPQAFLVEVTEDSMIPVYTPGDFALVEPGTEAEIEDDVLVRLATGETMIKRLLAQRGGYRFGSYNASGVLHYAPEDVSWVYYVAHKVPRKKIKSRW